MNAVKVVLIFAIVYSVGFKSADGICCRPHVCYKWVGFRPVFRCCGRNSEPLLNGFACGKGRLKEAILTFVLTNTLLSFVIRSLRSRRLRLFWWMHRMMTTPWRLAPITRSSFFPNFNNLLNLSIFVIKSGCEIKIFELSIDFCVCIFNVQA